MDERGFSDGRISRVDIWTVFGAFAADSVQISTLVQFASKYPLSSVRFSAPVRSASENPRSCVRISTLVRQATRTHRLPIGITASSPQSRGPIWVYSRGFDSIRPRWGAKGDCICPLPQPTRAPLPPRCWCPALPATALPSSAARPCLSSTRTPTCCATLPRALACCTWHATTKTRPLPLALRRRRPIPPACSIFLSTRCCADRPSSPSRNRLST